MTTEVENENLLKSIEKGYCTQDDFNNNDCLEYGGFYYSSDNYVLDVDDNISLRDDCFYCGKCEQYHDSNDYLSYELVTRQTTLTVCENCSEQHSYGVYNNQHYTESSANAHSLVRVEDVEENELRPIDEVYYWDIDCRYHLDPEDEDVTQYVYGYKQCSRQAHPSSLNYNLRCGFEIEKEDSAILTSLTKQDFKKETLGLWCKEQDGSLDDSKGFELVSPVFGLQDIPRLIAELKSNKTLLAHINAEYSKKCGGHIHISDSNFASQKNLFPHISQWVFLTYALYPKRSQNSYCQAMTPKELLTNSGHGTKYLAWRIQDETIELRICSAVRDIEHLHCRMLLVNAILNTRDLSPREAYYLLDSKTNSYWEAWRKATYADKNDKWDAMLARYADVLKNYNQWEVK